MQIKPNIQAIDNNREGVGTLSRLMDSEGRIPYGKFLNTMFRDYQGEGAIDEYEYRKAYDILRLPTTKRKRNILKLVKEYKRVKNLQDEMITIPTTTAHPNQKSERKICTPHQQTQPLVSVAISEKTGKRYYTTLRTLDTTNRKRIESNHRVIFEKTDTNERDFYTSDFYRVAYSVFCRTTAKNFITKALLDLFISDGWKKAQKLKNFSLEGYIQKRASNLWSEYEKDSKNKKRKLSIVIFDYRKQQSARTKEKQPTFRNLSNDKLSDEDIGVLPLRTTGENRTYGMNRDLLLFRWLDESANVKLLWGVY